MRRWGVTRSTRLRLVLPAIVAALVLSTALPGRGGAGTDGRGVRFLARVSWVAAEIMVVATEDGVVVSVDLREVPQDEYQRLASGDRVLVIGVLGRNRIVGTTIRSLGP
jgi:hypothetical protein